MSMTPPVPVGGGGFFGGGVYCPEHPTAELVEDYRAGDQICSECGLVVGDRVIDVGVEWRTFHNSEKGAGGAGGAADPSRVGRAENPLLSAETNLGTIIGGGRGPAAFDEAGVPKYRNGPGIPSADRALMSGFSEISLMGDRLNLTTQTADGAKNIFKLVQEGNGVKGRSTNAIASASVYIACRREGVPRTLKEICAVSKTLRKEIGRCVKAILAGFGSSSLEGITSGDFMSRFCAYLELPHPVQKAATCIAGRADKLDLVSGLSPISVAAAAIYMASQASKEKCSKKKIGPVAGVGVTTIRHAYKLLLPRAQELFPEGFQFCTPVELLPRA